MPTFKAESVVEALDYDLSPYVRAKGTIKEPSDAAIGRFLEALKEIMKEAQGLASLEGVDESDPLAVLSAINSLSGDAFVEIMAKMAGAFAELCNSKPGKDQILALPLRVRNAFFGWIMNEVVSPEAVPGAGIAPVTALPRAAAG